MMDVDIDIKDCPFCGDTAYLHEYNEDTFEVCCENCPAIMGGGSAQGAAKSWNNRSEPK